MVGAFLVGNVHDIFAAGSFYNITISILLALTMLVSLFVENGWILTVVFLAVSIALLLLCRSVVRKYFPKKIVATNVDSVIGTTGCVTASIDNLAATGQIKLGAMYWTARSTDNTIIPKGTVVRVDRVEGVKVFVSPVEIPVK